MLSYEQCAALKAAGYPQTGASLFCNEHGPLHEYEDAEACNGIPCPNSDELIAVIQQKHPAVGGYVDIIALAANLPHPEGGHYDYLLPALCALYIALADGGRE